MVRSKKKLGTSWVGFLRQKNIEIYRLDGTRANTTPVVLEDTTGSTQELMSIVSQKFVGSTSSTPLPWSSQTPALLSIQATNSSDRSKTALPSSDSDAIVPLSTNQTQDTHTTAVEGRHTKRHRVIITEGRNFEELKKERLEVAPRQIECNEKIKAHA
ncbi:hypothetical protein L211DRAFT_844405 [Terfezia boudieri ATCC MYA-4762]|uniref:Uncharacterized protein n=1 Tax=Terfezia boudieri ATCC MYA-4762 TaxID=1051890 RepID=A0A3N4M2M5_9PEZI|nr:hypothetical protein L211DRAFT_844405 [Terfezia boudieri ATCC MYA-4762]